MLEAVGSGAQAPAINHQAVALAQQARDRVATKEAWFGGSLSSMAPLQMQQTPQGNGMFDNDREQATVLADAGVDVLLTEMMVDTVSAPLVGQAAVETGLPVWVGFSAVVEEDGPVVSWRSDADDQGMVAEPLDEVVDSVIDRGVHAAGIMRSPIAATAPTLDVLAECRDGPRFAYAEIGTFANLHWFFNEVASPVPYLKHARSRVATRHTPIVDGCCGTGPEQIRVLRDGLQTETGLTADGKHA